MYKARTQVYVFSKDKPSECSYKSNTNRKVHFQKQRWVWPWASFSLDKIAAFQGLCWVQQPFAIYWLSFKTVVCFIPLLWTVGTVRLGCYRKILVSSRIKAASFTVTKNCQLHSGFWRINTVPQIWAASHVCISLKFLFHNPYFTMSAWFSAYLTGPDLWPSPIRSPNLAADVKLLEVLQVWKANISLGK